jgi:GNAT superfamily N-acetyltransferase
LKITQYDPSRRSDLADLTARVWGDRPSEAELAWFLEDNPVRPASVLLADDDEGRVIGSVAMSFLRIALGGETVEVGMPVRLATDPAARGRGVFAQLESANEARADELGISLLLIISNAASTPILLGRLGWTRLPAIRVWGRPWFGRRIQARQVEQLDPPPPGDRDGVVRDAAWLDWRFARSPTPYTLLEGDGYAVARRRGRLGVVAAVEGDLVRAAAVAAGGIAQIAAPPPAEHGRYARAGFVPTHRTLTVLGRSLGRPLPERVHFELGDLDFV